MTIDELIAEGTAESALLAESRFNALAKRIATFALEEATERSRLLPSARDVMARHRFLEIMLLVVDDLFKTKKLIDEDRAGAMLDKADEIFEETTGISLCNY